MVEVLMMSNIYLCSQIYKLLCHPKKVKQKVEKPDRSE